MVMAFTQEKVSKDLNFFLRSGEMLLKKVFLVKNTFLSGRYMVEIQSLRQSMGIMLKL